MGNHDDFVSQIALQSDGRIIAVGQTSDYPLYDFAVTRYTTTGRLDATFGKGGKVVTDFGNGNSLDTAYGVVLAPDGKIIVVGETTGPDQLDFDFAGGGGGFTDA